MGTKAKKIEEKTSDEAKNKAGGWRHKKEELMPLARKTGKGIILRNIWDFSDKKMEDKIPYLGLQGLVRFQNLSIILKLLLPYF